MTWLCKKQRAVSHSSTEAETISLEAGLRVEGVPAVIFWESVIDVFSSDEPKLSKEVISKYTEAPLKSRATITQLQNTLALVDYVPPSMPPPPGRAKLVVLEDNDAVIKLLIKGRSPALRHVGRTHSSSNFLVTTGWVCYIHVLCV